MFVAVDADTFMTYIHSPVTIHGETLNAVGPMTIDVTGDLRMTAQATTLPSGATPILFYGGKLTCQDAGGHLVEVMASTHDGLHVRVLLTLCLVERCLVERLFVGVDVDGGVGHYYVTLVLT